MCRQEYADYAPGEPRLRTSKFSKQQDKQSCMTNASRIKPGLRNTAREAPGGRSIRIAAWQIKVANKSYRASASARISHLQMSAPSRKFKRLDL
mmetsp:Transcript_55492/g.121474  ORF Transcript_55492/g.121474 Transcript_55492/m.121474 type:complete len:94 (-) Transcript_55492:509-790(-)